MRYSPFRHISSLLWKRRPIQLTVFLTRRCNARCPFCFYVTETNPDRPEGPELSRVELEKIAKNSGPLLWLAFSGGEIFLRSDLADVVAAFYRHTRPAIILLPTNGIASETIRERVGEIVRRCPRSTVVVKLSLDGPRTLHDGLRGVPGSFDRVETTLAGLREISERHGNLEVGINTVLCAANQDRVGETIEQVRMMEGVRTHTVSLVRGEISDPELKSVDVEKYGRTAEKLGQGLRTGAATSYRFAGAHLKAAQDILQRRLILKTLKENRRVIPCYAGRLTTVVTETGNVYPCESFQDKLGNLRENAFDLPRLLARPEARQAVDAIGGSRCFCTHECYMMMNVLFNPELLPVLFRETLRLRRRPRSMKSGKCPVRHADVPLPVATGVRPVKSGHGF